MLLILGGGRRGFLETFIWELCLWVLGFRFRVEVSGLEGSG